MERGANLSQSRTARPISKFRFPPIELFEVQDVLSARWLRHTLSSTRKFRMLLSHVHVPVVFAYYE